jgi:2-keto-4-pentenoate hydratase/2-oxohepta-3-ene-1,7-dioic acid hydratase in catechol pathway
VSWFSSEEGTVFRTWDPSTGKQGRDIAIQRFLAPAIPGKIIAVGLNYRDHAAELGLAVPEEPILFMKPASSVIGPGEKIQYPVQSGRVDYEAVLGVVIGRRCRNVRKMRRGDDPRYTCVNDVTPRDLQIKDGQWARAKSFDTFARWARGSRPPLMIRTTLPSRPA